MAAYRELGVRVEVAPYFEDMPELFRRADLVICRAGASALAELCAAGKASILIPFPHAADDHQRANARALGAAGAAVVVEDAEWSGRRMVDETDRLRDDAEAVRQMRGSAKAQARPGAAERAADILEDVAASDGGT